MILAPERIVLELGVPLGVQLGSDIAVPTAWAVAGSDDAAITDSGLLLGTLDAGDHLLRVTATLPDGTTEHESIVVHVPDGFAVEYPEVSGPVNTFLTVTPNAYGATAPIAYSDVGLGPDDTVDPVTGALRVLLDTERTGYVSGLDAAGRTSLAAVRISPVVSPVRASFASPTIRATVGDTLYEDISAVGGRGPYTYSFVGAPEWAALEGNRLTGIVESNGLIRVRVTDADGNTGDADLWLDVQEAPSFFLTIPSLDGGEGIDIPDGVGCSVQGGTTPFAFTLLEGPPLLTLDSTTGVFGGSRPPAEGEYPVRVQVVDANGLRAVAQRPMNVSGPEFALTLADITGAAGSVISEQPTANRAVSVWAKQSGPDYLTVNTNTGAVTGTLPDDAETATLVLFARSVTGETATLSVAVNVTDANISCSIANFTAYRGSDQRIPITVTNAPGGYELTITLSPPAHSRWITQDLLNQRLVVRAPVGETATGGTVTVRASRRVDSQAATCTATYTISDPTGLQCSIAGPAEITAGQSATFTFTASQGTPPYSWVLNNVSPRTATGASVRTTAFAPVGGGRIPVSARVTDAAGQSATCQQAVVVTTATLAPTCGPTAFTAQAGSSISQQFTASNLPAGERATAWRAAGLPSGLSMSSTGLLTGTAPSSTASFSVGFTVGARTHSCSVALTITAAPPPPLTCSAAPNIASQINAAFSAQIPAATGGSGTKTFAKASGDAFISISATGAVSGTAPAAAGTFPYSATVTDDSGSCTSSGVVTVTVERPAIVCAVAPVIRTTAGVAATGTIAEATGGAGTKSYALSSPPSWLTLAGRIITVSASAPAGSHSYTYTATDSTGTCSSTGTIAVASAPLVCPAAPNISVNVGAAFSAQIGAVTGGVGTATFSRVSGPTWLRISSTGLVTGTAPSSDSGSPFSYTYAAADTSGSCQGSGTVTVNVPIGTLVVRIATPTITVGLGSAASTRASASGGTGPYTFSKKAGSHASVVVSSGGNISLPAQTAAGTFAYTVVVTDADGRTAEAAGSFVVTNVVVLDLYSLPHVQPGVNQGSVHATVLGDTGYSYRATYQGGIRDSTTGVFTFANANFAGGLAGLFVTVVATKTGSETLRGRVFLDNVLSSSGYVLPRITVARGSSASSHVVQPIPTDNFSESVSESSGGRAHTTLGAWTIQRSDSQGNVTFSGTYDRIEFTASPPSTGVQAGTYIYYRTIRYRGRGGAAGGGERTIVVIIDVT